MIATRVAARVAARGATLVVAMIAALLITGRVARTQSPAARPGAPSSAAAPSPAARPVAASQEQAPNVSVADLPLDEAVTTADSRVFAVFFTGDGNFAALDQGVSAELTARGIPVVAFNQRSYLWSRKSPEQAGADLGRVLTWYRYKWHRDTVVIIGYSRGAGTAPIAVNRLPPSLRGMVKAVALIGAESTAGLLFRWRDLVSTTPAKDELPMAPELARLVGTPLLCFYGADEKDSPCPTLPPPMIPVKFPGGHYFKHDYEVIGRRIAEFALGDAKK